ncbi:MAG TPA: c-type cytochrome domain-containing protein [Bacteroidota bacterium]|nr:c-type cytochrome domain-containing protein [Bacteroidota bacterium]
MNRERLMLLGMTLLLFPAIMHSQSDVKKKKISFEKEVFPIIRSNCLPCHLAENENPSGLALDNYETLMKGGEHGNTVVPGKPKESYLYLKLLPNPPFGKQMARNKKKLSEEEIQVIYDWIEQGAKKE